MSPNKLPTIPNPLGQLSLQQDAQQQAGYSPAVNTTDLEARISLLESKRVNLNTDIIGLFETVSAVPAGTPRDVYDQIKIYVNGATLRLYVYDSTNHLWHYATLT